MENFLLNSTNAKKLILVLYKILIAFILIIILLIIFLKVNDTIYFNTAEIYLDNPKITINAPNNATIISIRVKEGDLINKGDTLVILQNKKIISDYHLSNKIDENSNNSNASITEIENTITEYEKRILKLKSDIHNRKQNPNSSINRRDLLTIIAPANGTISSVVTPKQYLEIISKDTPLVTINTNEEKYKAKIYIPEKDLLNISNGQNVSIKVNTHNYDKYETIKGEIYYITPSAVEGGFYCLINLLDNNEKIKFKSGYKVKGEIILKEMRLYEYIYQILFG